MTRRRAFAVALFVISLGLVGCSAIRATVDTDRALRQAGFSGAGVSAHVNDGYTTVDVNGIPAGGEQRAAGVVWRTFRYRVDEIDVSDQVFQRDELVAAFGPRNPVYDGRPLNREFTRVGKAVLVGLGFAGFAIAAVLILLIFFFVRRGRRANAAFT